MWFLKHVSKQVHAHHNTSHPYWDCNKKIRSAQITLT